MAVNCDDLKREIEVEFEKIKEAATNGNITDEMVWKSKFNDLVELAKINCQTLYVIEWRSGGYVLVAKSYP